MWEKKAHLTLSFCKRQKKIYIAELWLCVVILLLQGVHESHLTKR